LRRLLLFVVLAGCSRPTEPSTFQLRVAAAGDLAPLSPQAMGSYSAIAQDWVFEPLMHLETDGSMKPALAARLERIDRKSVRAWIRPDATFSDGSRVALKDVADSLTSAGLDASEQDGAVVVRSAASVLPETFLVRAMIFKDAEGAVLGTGPFFAVEQDATHLVLRRSHRLPNHIDEVVIRSFPTPREAFLRTLAGDADSFPFIDPKQVEFFENVPRFQVVSGPSPNAIAVSFNTKRIDRATRLALLANLGTPELARLAYPERCTPMRSEPVPFRPLPPGPRLNIAALARVGSTFERMALAVQRVLGPRAGEIEDISYPDYVRRLETGDFDLMIEMPLAWPPSDMALLWHSKSPIGPPRYANPRVDAAIDAGDWPGAMRELAEDPPTAFVCLPQRLAIMDARVKNPRVGPYGFFETLPDWEVER
jgi:ABC-type transport system substrate-binding protein